MSLPPEDRATLLALLHELGPKGERASFTGPARELGPRTLEELAALPGLDQLRAAVLRALPDLAEPAVIPELLHGADHALDAYPAMARESDPLLNLARHPAWVGLAAIELATLRDQADGLERAVKLAAVGFEDAGPGGPGEVLWAMAEQAEEAGWIDRSAELLQAALVARFDDESHRGDVRLVYGLHLAEADDARAIEVLTQVAQSSGPAKRRVHARWVLHALTRETQPGRAIEHLHEALTMLVADDEADPAVIERVHTALAGLGAPVPSEEL